MIKKLLSYGAIEGVAKGLNKLLLLLLPFFIDTVSFGVIGLIISIETLLPILTFLGLERAVLRFYSERQNFPSFLKSIVIPVNIVHGLLLASVVVLHSFGITNVFGIKMLPDLFLLVILVYFQGRNQLLLNILRVNENHKKYFRGRITIQVLKFVLVALLVFVTENYIFYMVGAIIASVVSNYLVRRDINAENGVEGLEKFKYLTFSRLFAFSWPFIFHGVSLNFLGNADKFVIERFLSMSDVGLYTFAYSLGTSVAFAFSGVAIYIEPLIYKEKNDCKREIILNKFLILSTIIAVVVYFMITIVSDHVLPKIYSDSYSLVFNYIPMVASAFIVYPFYLKSNYKLIYRKKTKSIAFCTIFISMLNIIMNIVMIPKYGLVAGIITTIICYSLQALIFIIISSKSLFNREILMWLLLSGIQILIFTLNLSHYYSFIAFCLYSIVIYFVCYRSTVTKSRVNMFNN